MKKLIFSLVFILAQNFVLAQKNFLDTPYVETSAVADSLVTPDKIYLFIQIDESDTKNKKSVEEQENAMASSLKKLGINTQKDLVLLDLASNFKNYFLRGKNVVKSKDYELVVNNAVTASKVIIELENIGISNVNIHKTEISNEEEILLDLKSKAVAKTKKIAEKLVKPLGQKVGKALHISENRTETYYSDMRPMAKMAYTEMGSPEPINIEFKKTKLRAEVFVKYTLE